MKLNVTSQQTPKELYGRGNPLPAPFKEDLVLPLLVGTLVSSKKRGLGHVKEASGTLCIVHWEDGYSSMVDTAQDFDIEIFGDQPFDLSKPSSCTVYHVDFKAKKVVKTVVYVA